MPIGCRYDRLTRPYGIRERARNDLRRVEVGRNVNIRGADELNELLQADKAIIKYYLAFDSLFLSQPLQRQTVGFTLVPQNMRMGRANDEVNHVGMLGQEWREEQR